MKLINKPIGLSKADQGGLTSRISGRASSTDGNIRSSLRALRCMRLLGFRASLAVATLQS